MAKKRCLTLLRNHGQVARHRRTGPYMKHGFLGVGQRCILCPRVSRTFGIGISARSRLRPQYLTPSAQRPRLRLNGRSERRIRPEVA